MSVWVSIAKCVKPSSCNWPRRRCAYLWWQSHGPLSCISPSRLLSGWAISKRYGTGIRDSYPVCSLLAHCHCHRRFDWHSRTVSSLGQRSLLPESPGGEVLHLACSGGWGWLCLPHGGCLCTVLEWVHAFVMSQLACVPKVTQGFKNLLFLFGFACL